MVDTEEAMESQFLTADLVAKSPTKKIVVIDPGKYEETNFGKKLSMKVNIDGKIKIWRPNPESVQNLQTLGKDSTDWMSKPIDVKVEKRSGRDCVIASVGIVAANIHEPPAKPEEKSEEVKPETEAPK